MEQIKFKKFFKTDFDVEENTGLVKGVAIANFEFDNEFKISENCKFNFGFTDDYPIYFFNNHEEDYSYANTKNETLKLNFNNKNLEIEVKLNLENSKHKDLFIDIKDKNILGLSCGIFIEDYSYDENTEIFKIDEVRIWEISATHMPANLNTSIEIQKSFNAIKSKFKKRKTLNKNKYFENKINRI